jgi:ribonucleoside-triphosphate reductase
MYSYDVTTDSDHFEVSGIYSHNCRSALTVYHDENGNSKFYGRFNQGVVTLNLVDVALSSEKNLDKFWNLMDERTELCHRALQIRHERLTDTPSDVAPILWQYGALARLNKGESINKLLHNGYSTISLGYAGLYECVKYMTEYSHTDKKGKTFGLHVMQYMNDKCNEWKTEEKIDYSIYGSPIESTTYKFAKCLKKRFGVIEGITDKDYITNSYHVPVFEEIDAFTKLKLESEFQALSPGGAISSRRYHTA